MLKPSPFQTPPTANPSKPQIVRLHEAGERSGLATAIMEHAAALVNLASALYVTRRFADAKGAYESALEVFELVEDVDKVRAAGV